MINVMMEKTVKPDCWAGYLVSDDDSFVRNVCQMIGVSTVDLPDHTGRVRQCVPFSHNWEKNVFVYGVSKVCFDEVFDIVGISCDNFTTYGGDGVDMISRAADSFLKWIGGIV